MATSKTSSNSGLFAIDFKAVRRGIFSDLINENPDYRVFYWNIKHSMVRVIEHSNTMFSEIKSLKKQGCEFKLLPRLMKIPGGGLYDVTYYSGTPPEGFLFNSPLFLALETTCAPICYAVFRRLSKKRFDEMSLKRDVIDWSDAFQVKSRKVKVEANKSAQR